MARTATSDPSTKSGIRKLSNGESVIPSSTRPDGSVRKEIRVKPGYKPPEDVEVYKNRTAEAWKSRGKGGVPGAETLSAGGEEGSHKAAANKNAKRKEARKKAAAVATEGKEDGEDVNGVVMGHVKPNGNGVEKSQEETDPDVEQAKEARKLAKKLRQARELSEKQESGGDLLPEQFAKVIKMNELIRQLDSLGFDTEGEKKTPKDDEEAAG